MDARLSQNIEPTKPIDKRQADACTERNMNKNEQTVCGLLKRHDLSCIQEPDNMFIIYDIAKVPITLNRIYQMSFSGIKLIHLIMKTAYKTAE